MTKIRSIRQVVEVIKEEDKDTAITESAIRRLIREEKIPVKRIGKKMLLNIDTVKAYFGEAV